MTATDQITTTHQISGDHFAALAGGYGNPGAIAVLRAGQLSKRLHLLHALLASVRPEVARRTGFADGFALLARLHCRDPETTADVLLHPFTDRWATVSLQRIQRDPDARDADLEYLRALASTAAIRAGVPAMPLPPARGGWILLPSLGRLASGASLPADLTRRSAAWQPLRCVTAAAGGRQLTVRLDDLDPYRDVLGDAVSGRLGTGSAARWARTIRAAWDLLATGHPHRAGALAAGLRAIVPLTPGPDGRSASASSAQAFGAMSVSTSDDPVLTALLMVHEFQHMKLAALLDMADLYDPGHDRLYHAPWRSDPRPLGALLQGIYAHLGVVDFWRVHRTIAHDPQCAHFEFARWRELTTLAMRALTGCGALTELGRRFAAGMAATTDSWQNETVPLSIAAAAHHAATENSRAWHAQTGMTPVHAL